MSAKLNDQERVELAKAIMGVLDDWQVEAAERVVLLGLPDTIKPRAMARYRGGEPLPDDDEILERCRHVLEIEHALHSAFPTNPAMAKLWVTTASPQFQERSPLEVMLRDGLPGLTRVWRHLKGGDEWGM